MPFDRILFVSRLMQELCELRVRISGEQKVKVLVKTSATNYLQLLDCIFWN